MAKSRPLDLAPGPYRTTRVQASVWLCEIEVQRRPTYHHIRFSRKHEFASSCPTKEIIDVCLQGKVDITYERIHIPFLHNNVYFVRERWTLSACVHSRSRLPYRREILALPEEASRLVSIFSESSPIELGFAHQGFWLMW